MAPAEDWSNVSEAEITMRRFDLSNTLVVVQIVAAVLGIVLTLHRLWSSAP